MGFCYILLASVGTANSGSNTHFILFSGGAEEEQTGCLSAWSSMCEYSQLPTVLHHLMYGSRLLQAVLAWKQIFHFVQTGVRKHTGWSCLFTVITLLTTLGPFKLPVSPTSGCECSQWTSYFQKFFRVSDLQRFPLLISIDDYIYIFLLFL